ncbi:MAG TPA: lytic murein transglycosylase, partial [Erythrobacter sp.]|nr:lytic murein transglycosylase [Erythrobacter sp.]
MILRPLAAAALAASALASAAPVMGQGDSVDYFTRSHAAALPQLLSADERGYYASLFAAIEARNWDRVEVMLAGRSEGPL